MAMAGTTSTFRFPVQHNSDLRKLAVNLAPFPRLHFFTIGFAPLKSRRSKTNSLTVPELIYQVGNTKNMLASCDPHRGVYLTASVHFRGRYANRTVDEQIANLKCRYSSYFVDWIPSFRIRSQGNGGRPNSREFTALNHTKRLKYKTMSNTSHKIPHHTGYVMSNDMFVHVIDGLLLIQLL